MKVQWLAENGPCQRCASWEKPTIDHIDPATKDPELRRHGGGTQRIWYWSNLRRDRELAKCQVLCEACHRKKSQMEQRRDALELSLRAAELQRKATMNKLTIEQTRKELLLSKYIPLDEDLEARIAAVRKKYGWDEEELPIRRHEEPPEEWPTGLIIWPF
jgi:hypothetical protein